jgi:oxepin-CoA hydrolase/3-oxo-5,6-dehydrosuberyl-CoA semialdehyde dehydrogenase
MLDVVHDRKKLFALLRSLDPHAAPLFGKMTPQHMVEHLTSTVKMANGKMPVQLKVNEESAKATKAAVIYTDYQMEPGIKSALLGDDPPPYVNKNITDAIAELKKELSDFDEYFKQHPDMVPVQHRMGALTHDEWVMLYNKHFAHHLRQFGLE